MIKNKNILVTGGAGTVGSNLVKKFSKRGATVTVIDNLSAYPFNYQDEFGITDTPNANFVKGDVLDKKLVNDLIKKSDIVVHFAALADVGACVRNPTLEFESNVAATQNILDACLQNNVEKFVFASSAAVYGQGVDRIFKEDQPCFPVSNYALSKYWGEQQTRLYHELYDLPTSSIRFFSVYGAPQIPKKGSHSWAIAIFGCLAKRKKPITVYGDGSQIRDMTHVQDIAESVVLSTEKSATNGKFFNVGTGKPTTVNTMVEKVFNRVGEVPVDYKPHPKGDPFGGFADTTLMKKLLDWEPEITLDNGVNEYFDWLEDHEHLIPEWV